MHRNMHHKLIATILIIGSLHQCNSEEKHDIQGHAQGKEGPKLCGEDWRIGSGPH